MPSTKNSSNYTEEDVQSWGRAEVSAWLRSIKLDSCIEDFESSQIDGQRLLLLTWDELKTLECLRDEKKKKIFKKALGNLPGKGASSDTKQKGKKFGIGGGTRRGGKGVEQPVPSLPPPQAAANPPGWGPPSSETDAPALPPRPRQGLPAPPTSQPPPSHYPPPTSQPPHSHYPPPTSQPPHSHYPPSQPPPSHYPPPSPSTSHFPPPPSQPPPPPSQPSPKFMPHPPNMRPPINMPHPPNMRPPLANAGYIQDSSGYDEESEGIYDAVPDSNIEPDETEDIYDVEDSFSDGEGEIEEEYEGAEEIQQQMGRRPNNNELLSIQAKFYAHGIGTINELQGRQGQARAEDEDEEIYDEGTQDWPPQGNYPPPPPGAPPPDGQYIDEEIYDVPPDQMEENLPHPPGAPPPADDFGYTDEDIYDIADDDNQMTGQSFPPPPQGMPLPLLRPPLSQPLPPQNMPRPPLRPPLPPEDIEEDIGGEEIYDCMDEVEEEPAPVQTHTGMGIRPPPMRAPIGSSSPVTAAANKPLLRPPINQPGVSNVHQMKLQTFANQEPPPRPSSNTKPISTFQEVQQSKLMAAASQAPPTRPSSTTKPPPAAPPPPSVSAPPPPPAPPPPSVVAPPTSSSLQEDDEEDGSGGGGLANELAAMKKRLRAGSTKSPSATPTNEKKVPSFAGNTTQQTQRPQASVKPGMGDDSLASSIAQARLKLRSKSEQPQKEETKAKQSPPQIVRSGIQKQPKDLEQPPKRTTPPSSPKPVNPPKPQITKEKPPLRQKPALAPKSDKISSLMKSFQTPSGGEPPAALDKSKRKSIELDRSPMTGRKIDRKESVKELTQRYSSGEEELSPRHNAPPSPFEEKLRPPPAKPPRPPTDTPAENAAMNMFKRRQMENESGAPPSLPGKKFLPAPVETSPAMERGGPRNVPHPSAEKPQLPGRRLPSSSAESNQQPPLPGRPLPQQSDAPPLPGRPLPQQSDAPPLPGRPLPQQSDAPPLPGRPLPQQSDAPPLPGRPLPQQNDAPPLPGRPLPQQNDTPPLPGRPLPQQNAAPPLPGRPLPQQNEAPPLPGRPLPQQNEAPPPFSGRPLPQQTEAPPLPGRPFPQQTEAPPLPGRPLPQQNEAPPLPGRPHIPQIPPQQQQLPAFKPPLRPPVEDSAQQLPSTDPPVPVKASQTGLPVGQSWYHAALDRKNAEAKIKKYHKDGTFIVRDNTRNPGEYSLSLWFEGGIRHLRIRKRTDSQFVLGEEKPDEMAFSSVVDLVNFYKTEPVVLKSGGQTPLKFECPH